MTYNVFGGTLSLTQSINRERHIEAGCIRGRSALPRKMKMKTPGAVGELPLAAHRNCPAAPCHDCAMSRVETSAIFF